jgi:signal transduction histidine kinase
MKTTPSYGPSSGIWNPPASTPSAYLPPREVLLIPLPVLLIATPLLWRLATPIADLIGIASIVSSVLIGTWLARRRSAPVQAFAEAVHRLSEGELDVTIAVTESGEFGRLQHAFNATAAALRSSIGQLDQQIRHTTAQLNRKVAEVEAVSAAKTRFLAAASHDLRQPLYALNLLAAKLHEGEADLPRRERIGQLQHCIASLDRMFNSLLDESQLRSGIEKRSASRFDLDDLFIEVSRNFRSLAEQRGLRLIVRPTKLQLHADRDMLARVLNNLVCNALRYTQHGGVLLGARRRGTHAQIDVWDTGVGIAAEHQPHIFDEFVRFADSSGNAGRGLGLATVRRLCHTMKAPLTLRSIEGSGTAFHLLLPRAAASVAAKDS